MDYYICAYGWIFGELSCPTVQRSGIKCHANILKCLYGHTHICNGDSVCVCVVMVQNTPRMSQFGGSCSQSQDQIVIVDLCVYV